MSRLSIIPLLAFLASANLQAAPPTVSITSPSTGTANLTTGCGLVLSANVTPGGNGTTSTVWSMLSGPAAVTFGDVTSTSTTSTFPADGTYVLRLTASDTIDTASADVTVVVGAISGFTPQGVKYGAATTGSHTVSSGTYTITSSASSGIDSGATSDGLYSLEQQLSGDFNLTARIASATDVASASGSLEYERVGLVIRSGTSATGNEAAAFIGYDSTAPAYGYWITRATSGAANVKTTDNTGYNFPRYVRLARTGSTVTGYLSADGTTWVSKGSMTLPGSARVGLAWSSDNPAASGSATFDNVNLTSLTGVNVGPVVSAGPDTTAVTTTTLSGTVADDGLPSPPAAVTTTWSRISGPGTVTFANPSDPATSATFSQFGTHVLRITASDGQITTFDDVTITTAPATPDPSGVYAWYKADSGITVGADGYTAANWTNSATTGTPATRNLGSIAGAPFRWNMLKSGNPTYVMRFNGGSDGIFATRSNFGTLSASRSVVAYVRTRETGQGFLFDSSSFNVGLTRAQINGGNWQIGTVASGGAAATAGTATAPATLDAWQVHSFVLTAASPPTFEHFINGVKAGSTVTLANAYALDGLILGNSASPGAGLGADIDIAEMLVYNSALTESSRLAVENYLTSKWDGLVDGVNNPPQPITSTSQPFKSGTGYNTYRIPAMCTSNQGTVIVAADGRANSADIPTPIDCVIRRSTDNGTTWGPNIVVANYGTNTTDTDTYPLTGSSTPLNRTSASDPALLVDRTNGRIWVFYDNGSNNSYNGWGRTIKLEMRYSDDDGLTWSARRDIEAENPNLRPKETESFSYGGTNFTYGKGEFIVGPGNGIQIERGIHAGRLVFPVYWYRSNNHSSFIYSDDHGTTWQRGGVCGTGTGEIQMVELTNGDLLASMRPSGAASGYRWFSKSTDGGATWGAMFRFDSTATDPVPDPACQGSVIRISTTADSDKNRLVHANCNSTSGRTKMTVRTSYDEGSTWSVSRLVYGGASAYSSLTRLANGDIGLLYEKDGTTSIDFVRISIPQATGDTDNQPPYNLWANQCFTLAQLMNPLVSGPNADPDGDGRTNAQEFADGSNPLVPLNRPLRVFVLTGQSNSLGTLGTTDTTMRFTPVGSHPAEQSGGVLFFWNNRADSTTAGDSALGDSGGTWGNLAAQTGGYYAGNDDHWGPEIGFARMLWNSGLRDFAIVKASSGGGGNTLWQKGSSDDHMYQHVISTVNAAVTSLPPGFSRYEIAGLLYVQGESNNATEAAEAGSRFDTLLTNLKSDLGNTSSMVGVFGEIAGTGTDRDTTRANQLALAGSRSDIGYAESTGLTIQNQDGLSVHYDAESQILLGERMAAEFLATSATIEKPLPAWNNLYAWYSADNGMTLDTSNAVNRWSDIHNGSATRDLTRKVAGLTFRRDVIAGNGTARKVMRFDGTNDLWANASTEFGAISGNRSVALLCRLQGSSNGYLFDGTTGTGRTRAQSRGGKWQAGVGSSWDETDPDAGTATTGVWQQHVFTYTTNTGSTTVKHWIDGTLASTTTDTGTANLGGLIIGSNGGSPFTRTAVDIAEIAVFNTALGEQDVSSLKSAWDSRWGAITPPPFSASVTQTPRMIPRFGKHDVLKIEVNNPNPGLTTLQQIRVETTAASRAAVRRWSLHSSGVSSTFSPSSTPLSVVESAPSGPLVFPAGIPLAEGTNIFWIAAEPEPSAPIGTEIDASIVDLTTTGVDADTVTPSNPDPSGALTLAVVPLFNDVRTSGEGGITTYRIPGITCDTSGVLHAVYDHRYNGGSDLPANIDIGYSRSTDGGATWSASKVILDFDSSVSGSSGNGVGDPCILHDPVTNTLWVAALWSFGNHGYSGSGAGTDPTQTGQYVLTKSTDGGLTWSAPINITTAVKDDTNWRLIFQGPGHGFAMRDGTLVFPSQRINASGVVQSCSVFSTDHGATWDFGSYVPATSPNTNENTACELDDGRILFSMRTPSGSNGQRAWAHYTPGGAIPMRDGSWSSLYRTAAVPDPVCQGSVIQWTSKLKGHARERILYAGPGSSSSRVNMTLRVSGDGGMTWPVSKLLYSGSSAYSSLCVLPDNSIGLLFERDNYTKITFVRIEEAWLFDPETDTDHDGLGDAWETFHGVTDPSSDPDGDGQDNLMEQAAGTDPLDRNSLLRAISLSPGQSGITFTWQSVPGLSYQVETSSDLQHWTPSSTIRATGASTSHTEPANNNSSRFYRARTVR